MILGAKRLGFGGETTNGDRGEMTCGGKRLGAKCRLLFRSFESDM